MFIIDAHLLESVSIPITNWTGVWFIPIICCWSHIIEKIGRRVELNKKELD